MTSEEALLFKTIIREKIDIRGGCRMLSLGSECSCPLCQIDNMDADEIKGLVENLITNGYNTNRPFLLDQVKRDSRCKGCSWEPADSGCNTRFGSDSCKLNKTT